MASRQSRDLAIGTTFALALVILALAVMTVGGEIPGFSNRVRYAVVFPNTDGLLLGAPVRMGGVEIGEVTSIRLPTDPQVLGIEVEVGIRTLYAERIREDSGALLRILQLLTNEKYVEVLAGSPDRPALPAGSRLPIRQDPGVLERGEAIAENLIDITLSLKRILEPLERGESLLGRIIQDPDFGLEGVEAFGETLKNAQKLTDDLARGEGLIGRLLQDDELALRLDTLSQSVEDFASLMTSLSERRGVLGDLLDEDGSGQAALRDLREAAGSFRRLGERLESEKTVLGQLLAEQECASSVASDVCDTVGNLAEVTGKINDGQGTLGALVNERDLYDGAQAMLSGTGDSKFARWLLRRYRKKGVKAQESDPPESQPEAGED